MENARTTSSAAARAAPRSAKCPMVTPGGAGRGGAQGGGGSLGVPGRGTLPDPGTPSQVRADGTRAIRTLPCLALGRQRRH